MRLKITEPMARNMAALEEGCSVTAGCLDIETFFIEVEQRAAEPAKKSEDQKVALRELDKVLAEG